MLKTIKPQLIDQWTDGNVSYCLPTNKPSAQLTGDDGDRSTDVPQLLPGEVFDQAADKGAFSHLGGPDNYNHNWRGFQRSPVHEGDVMFFGLYVLSPTGKTQVKIFFTPQKLLLGFVPGWMCDGWMRNCSI